MVLTQQIIKDTLLPITGRKTLTDGRGLQLRLTSSGKRTWSLQYRFNCRMLKTTIGEWPAVSVAEARKIADAERLKLAKSLDPQAEKKNAKIKGLSFQAAWERFDALYIAEKKPKTAKEYRRSARVDLLPRFKSLALKDVTKSDIVALIDNIRRRAPVMANRTLSLLSKFYSWCLGKDYVEKNLTLGIPKAKEAERDRVLSIEELRAIYRAAGKLSRGNELFVKLLLLTGQREGVIARLEQDEVKDNYLEISAERNKSGERIKVRLSSLSKDLLFELGSSKGKYVVSTTEGLKPISGFSKLKKKLDAVTGIEEHWTFHDIRGGMTTYLEENGLDRIYTSRILNHKDTSTTGIYARPEHRQHIDWVLEQWSQVLASNDGFSSENVLLFAR